MRSIRNAADLARALDGAMDPDLRRVLSLRRDQLGPDLGEYCHIILVQRGDTLAAVEAEADVPIGTNLVTGARLGEPDFTPSFDYAARHGGWIEAVASTSDDFTLALFLPDRVDIDPLLLCLVRRAL